MMIEIDELLASGGKKRGNEMNLPSKQQRWYFQRRKHFTNNGTIHESINKKGGKK
jgi:hypothetical protein